MTLYRNLGRAIGSQLVIIVNNNMIVLSAQPAILQHISEGRRATPATPSFIWYRSHMNSSMNCKLTTRDYECVCGRAHVNGQPSCGQVQGCLKATVAPKAAVKVVIPYSHAMHGAFVTMVDLFNPMFQVVFHQ